MSVSNIFQSIGIATPTSITSVTNRSELHRRESVSLDNLKPGTSSALWHGEDKTIGTNDDRIVFSNGGSISDLPGEGGLLLTTPDGTATKLESYGWVDPNWDKDRMEVFFKVPNAYADGFDTWSQGFNADGTVSLSRLDDDGAMPIHGKITQDGKLTAWNKNWEGDDQMQNANLESGVAVFEDLGPVAHIAIAPPVPLEWLLA